MSVGGAREADERQAFIKKVNSLPWFHQINLGDGICRRGEQRLRC